MTQYISADSNVYCKVVMVFFTFIVVLLILFKYLDYLTIMLLRKKSSAGRIDSF